MNLRKINRVIHRDLGYLFCSMCLIYGLSGIAMNHLRNWNPSYIINNSQLSAPANLLNQEMTKDQVTTLLHELNITNSYKKHYYPKPEILKIFITGGSIEANTSTHLVEIETISKRPLFNQTIFLHYNPGKLWLWYSDAFAVALMFLAISGLFILKGKNGIKRRGAILTSLGLIIPLIFLYLYL